MESDSRPWQADREAIFERDNHACRYCDSDSGPDTDSSSCRVAAVGDVALEGTVHESALVTVCDDCFRTLHRSQDAVFDERTRLFETIRDVTRRQSDVISTVASFASLATQLPAAIEDGENDRATYVIARQDACLALAMVDATLDPLERAPAESDLEALAAGTADGTSDAVPNDGDEAGDDPPAETLSTALESFCTAARSLQRDLRKVVELSDGIAVGLGCCYGCFTGLEGADDPAVLDPDSSRQCPTCGLESPALEGWRDGDGDLAFDALYGAINDSLQASSKTTTALTARTQVVAECLFET
ncbi:HNH endonuclease [Natronosalvus rutilus]|uniref:HNH endonuclease n=1 Tax=Natronosalvus rutilus TaxID=2953753 RepID=A0A9E7NBD7_9EURY|nr:HNH endonuclease [Natronosalvus rutilus]UTF53899.1 HNH endonuclease [Natronosalvus rutilus]